MSTLRTPEQVSADLGLNEDGRPILRANTIRTLARSEQIECVRLERGKIVFTDSQVQSMLDYLTKPAAKHERTESVFGASKRSNSAARMAR